MKKYRIEAFCKLDATWKPVLGTPTEFSSRTEAESRLKLEAYSGIERRCRLVNRSGKVVMFAGVNQ